ncbi:Sorting nexin-21-like protein [Dinothrombium tinctorium]|uniref:Sorting nexin-21-like protein n=1 Tax=Dinothrombium tinctorium TaxID=1965070 RepID=A0A3S3S3B1_9ACAR|nr:Sorting nexin-21-like protein [Dinothrombium tinctorium]RWS13720.1 Sorting nexin-21-like protein [Dinothrombium tinctorium]
MSAMRSTASGVLKGDHFSTTSSSSTSEALINNGASSKFEPLVTPSWTDDTIESSTPRKVCYRVAFEIISAKSTTCQRSAAPKKKFVLYSILVKRTPGLEPHPGLIERRLLNDFPFPKKTIVGNFSPEVITERSVAFQHLLALCLSVTELRRTQQFYDFLCGRELKEARRAMRVAQFEESSIVLENVYYIQEKLLLHDSEFCSSVFRTLCVLIASLNAVNNVNDAQNYAEKAIEIIKKHNLTTHAMHNELIAAFVILCKKMFWSLAEQKQFLDTTLDEMKLKAVKVDKLPTLLELVMQKDYTSSLTMQ